MINFLCIFKGATAIIFAEQSRNQNCINLLKQTRPVKQNTAKLSRLKRSVSSNDKSEPISNGAAATTSDNNKKFENIFNNNKNANSLSGENRASKYYKSQEDTSEMGTEDKSGANALSNNKSDKWGDEDEDDDDSEQDDDSLSYSQEINKEKTNVSHQRKQF
jgi:hypothetical protein